MAGNDREKRAFFVTRESQIDHKSKDKKLSYVGMRDFSQVDKIEEEDILGPGGELRGIKNRVRAGLANFQDVDALTRVIVAQFEHIYLVSSNQKKRQGISSNYCS